MRPYSLDDHWTLLSIEYHAADRATPWLDQIWYHVALRWLRWRIRRAGR